jgi:peroxiredoxin
MRTSTRFRTPRFHILGGVALAAVAAFSFAAGQQDTATPAAKPATPQKAEVGKPAPAWTLTDTKGTAHNLSDFKGRIVVMEWFSPYCPWSGAEAPQSVHYNGRAKRLHEELKKVDPEVVYLLVDSTHIGFRQKTHEDLVNDAATVLSKTGTAFPVLLDSTGVVGKAYDARTTPHVFVIDAEGVLRYQGAFDSDRSGREREPTNYVLGAVKAIKAGETPAPATTRPWGCSVKYAD